MKSLILCIFAFIALASAEAVDKRCEVPCTRIYLPVCATDGQHFKTFSNECVMRNEHCRDGRNWSQVRMSDCQDQTYSIDVNCEKPCTREYMPVCGTDGQHYKFFANTCVLNNQHCKDGKAWKEARVMFCVPRPQSMPLERCEVPCTREYKPICAFDGQSHKMFNNLCMMKNEHCHDGHNWVQTKLSECLETSEMSLNQRCERPCTREYRPVCGSDGKSYKMFSNPCVFRNQHCKDGKSWAEVAMRMCQENVDLESAKLQRCEKPCTRDYTPVCGTDGEHFKVFSNECVLRNQHCKDGQNWLKTRATDCAQLYSSPKQLCEVPCTRELRLTCGFNGVRHQIFNNPCLLRNAHCIDGKDWIQTRMEECSNKTDA